MRNVPQNKIPLLLHDWELGGGIFQGYLSRGNGVRRDFIVLFLFLATLVFISSTQERKYIYSRSLLSAEMISTPRRTREARFRFSSPAT